MPKTSAFVTPHFKWSEFACHDEARTPVPEDLEANARIVAIECERIRAACLGRKLRITEGYRTKAYNEELARRGYPAAPKSYHLQALAADLVPVDGMTLDDFVRRIRTVCALISECRIRYVKIYKDGHVHIDCRPTDKLLVEDERAR